MLCVTLWLRLKVPEHWKTFYISVHIEMQSIIGVLNYIVKINHIVVYTPLYMQHMFAVCFTVPEVLKNKLIYSLSHAYELQMLHLFWSPRAATQMCFMTLECTLHATTEGKFDLVAHAAFCAALYNINIAVRQWECFHYYSRQNQPQKKTPHASSGDKITSPLHFRSLWLCNAKYRE